jgi:hypothetical protein
VAAIVKASDVMLATRDWRYRLRGRNIGLPRE